jgi:hypothetical protein
VPTYINPHLDPPLREAVQRYLRAQYPLYCVVRP